jgi:hypothetical protein
MADPTRDPSSGAGANPTNPPAGGNNGGQDQQGQGAQNGGQGGRNQQGQQRQRTAGNAFEAISFVAEIDDGKGGRLQLNCRPRLGKIVRGRFDLAKLGERIMDDRLKGLPTVIPGILFSFNGAARKIGFHDPLAFPKNQALRKAVGDAIKNYTGQDQSPEKVVEYAELSDDDLKNWLYWMRRHLDAKQIVVHKGAVPDMKVIEKMPGRVRHQPMDKNPKAEFVKPDFPYLAPGQSPEEQNALVPDYDSEMSQLFGGHET